MKNTELLSKYGRWVYNSNEEEFSFSNNSFKIALKFVDGFDDIENFNVINKIYKHYNIRIDEILKKLKKFEEKEFLKKILIDADLWDRHLKHDKENWALLNNGDEFTFEKYVEYENYSTTIFVNKESNSLEIQFMLSDIDELFGGHWYEIFYDENLNYKNYEFNG